MKISRTVFKGQIVSEFLAPARITKKQKVLIICQGMPGAPKKDALLELFSKKGYWVFFPRYRGSWESMGKFLKKSPHLDILDIISELPRGFKDSQTGKKIRLNPDKVFLIGSSFGGPAAILASKDRRVDKVVCLSPVIDWTYPSKEEPLNWFGKFVKEYWGRAYDFDLKDWQKLAKGNFYNPINEVENLDGRKILIIHAKNDKVVSFRPAQKFTRLTNCHLKFLKKGDHLGSGILLKNRNLTMQITSFLNQK